MTLRVNGLTLAGTPRRIAPASIGAAGFRVDETAARPEGVKPEAAGASASVALAGLLSLQEHETGSSRDKAARLRASAMLGRLRRLQRDLLSGGDLTHAGDELEALLRDSPEAEDPALARIVAAIALRVRIEIAKRQM